MDRPQTPCVARMMGRSAIARQRIQNWSHAARQRTSNDALFVERQLHQGGGPPHGDAGYDSLPLQRGRQADRQESANVRRAQRECHDATPTRFFCTALWIQERPPCVAQAPAGQ